MTAGDTVYGRRGDIGRRAFIGKRQEGWLCGTGCLRIRPDPAAVNPRYLFDTLGSPETAGVIANRAKGATMPNLNATLMRSVPLLVAPRQLQDYYSEYIEPSFELADVLDEQNRKLRSARDLLFPRLMRGQIAV
jgi:type I restriction enzyme S subunit